MRRDKPHPILTEFRLCKEFGWTPKALARQPAKTVEAFVVIMNEMDRQTEEEMRKAKREARQGVR
jgi:hypothetical protein